ncbi:ADP-ribosylglycohydrolase family protein [Luteococcus sp. Sow4_B9]|uniref:ADP-ribosylglycohydrolase family protein n=1 Tax=Luteococcus sp. Sow4_B9 TaxID=3438792 RepID=UPI003F96319D
METLPVHPDRKRRIQTLLGIACADALGAATEFRSPAEIAAQFSPDDFASFQPGSPFGFEPGEATDDTQMLVARLLRPGDPLGAYRRWLAGGPPDVGNLTREALQRGGLQAWESSGCHSAGNGGLMRVASVWIEGLVSEPLIAAAILDTALTHIDPRCTAASTVLVAAMDRLAHGDDYRDAWLGALEDVRRQDLPALLASLGITGPGAQRWQTSAEGFGLVERAVLDGLAGTPCPQSGYVLHTLQCAVQHGAARTWSDGVVPVVMGGDDADTVAAVTAAVLGARGLTAPDRLTGSVRLGADWDGWQRTCLLADHVETLVP